MSRIVCNNCEQALKDCVCTTHTVNIEKDAVNPTHYDGDYCMQVIEHVTKGLSGSEGYLTGVILKYLWRWKRKNGVEDLKKVRWYLDRLIKNLENEKPSS